MYQMEMKQWAMGGGGRISNEGVGRTYKAELKRVEVAKTKQKCRKC